LIRGQLSLEALLAIAAYFALIAAFVHLELGLAGDLKEKGDELRAAVDANAACLSLDFQYIDGRSLQFEPRLDTDSIEQAAGNRTIVASVSGQRAEAQCLAEVAKSQGKVQVDPSRDLSRNQRPYHI